jgi:hypothetical protein
MRDRKGYETGPKGSGDRSGWEAEASWQVGRVIARHSHQRDLQFATDLREHAPDPCGSKCGFASTLGTAQGDSKYAGRIHEKVY